MPKPFDDSWRDFPPDEEPVLAQAGPKLKRRLWAPMSEILQKLAAGVCEERVSDVVSDVVAQIANDDGDDNE